ncbi:MAG: hypothetical protein KDI75_12710 [Xanthomonadales bacterium]|nr:hypothetical protein [Xanthomonadales bacterium]
MRSTDQGAVREVIDGRTIWRKRYGGEERRLLKWLLRQLCVLLRTPALRPVRSQTAAGKCRTERQQIERLASLGMPVPDAVATSTVEICLSDLGPSLAQVCRSAPDVSHAESLVRAGFDALLDLHRRGGNLSQAFARNMTWQDGRVGFIDLEEDPLTVMDLHQAQARDVLFYVSSSARFMSTHPQRYADLLLAHLSCESAAVREEVQRTAHRLRWVSPLARLGGMRAQALAVALESLRQAG